MQSYEEEERKRRPTYLLWSSLFFAIIFTCHIVASRRRHHWRNYILAFDKDVPIPMPVGAIATRQVKPRRIIKSPSHFELGNQSCTCSARSKTARAQRTSLFAFARPPPWLAKWAESSVPYGKWILGHNLPSQFRPSNQRSLASTSWIVIAGQIRPTPKYYDCILLCSCYV